MKMTSFNELREYSGLKPVKGRKEKPVICKRCGAEMRKVATNTWYCGKELTDKDGKVILDKENKPKLCLYTYIKHIA